MDERILVIEDDEKILHLLRRILAFEGYEVYTAAEGKSGLALARERKPDLVILDWMLPDIDGLEVGLRLRKMSSVPILMLTAKDQVEDKVEGLDAFADDYMVKPFAVGELLARIRALLRRTSDDRAKELSFADLTLYRNTRKAIRGDRVIELTAKEYDLLELFMRHPQQVLTRKKIFESVWNYDFGGESNVLDVYIRYLRQKLEEGGEERLVFTVRSVGYVMRKPD